MKKTITLITLLFSIYSYSQITESELNGSWIKIKSEMKDGSKLFTRFQSDSTFIECLINKNKICFNSTPIFVPQSCLSFELKNNVLRTSQLAGYEIEKITRDSLVLSQKIVDMSDDKAVRNYFVRKDIIHSKFKEKNKDKKDIIATKFYTPTTSYLLESDFIKPFTNNFKNFELIGNIKILVKEKKVITEIIFSTKKDSSSIKIVKEVLNNSFERLNLTNFEEYSSIQIPFIFKCEITNMYRGTKLLFFANDLKEFDILYGGKLGDIRQSSELFKKGLEAYSKKKYLKAIEYFNESYKFDSKNIDALYNKAAVYYESGDLKNACNTWREISDLGQVIGKELYQSHCN